MSHNVTLFSQRCVSTLPSGGFPLFLVQPRQVGQHQRPLLFALNGSQRFAHFLPFFFHQLQLKEAALLSSLMEESVKESSGPVALSLECALQTKVTGVGKVKLCKSPADVTSLLLLLLT